MNQLRSNALRGIDIFHDEGTGGVPFPINQQHMADALGMSLVHTNMTLRKLEKLGFHRIHAERVNLMNAYALTQLADVAENGCEPKRPLF